MSRYYYDLHIHSCLSPCGDNDNTPNNIVGMGVLAGLQIMALTDHNTCRNCPAFFEAAREEHPVEAVSIDCNDLLYVSSAGLRVLVMMRKACQGGVTLANPNELVTEIVAQTGFGAVLTIA